MTIEVHPFDPARAADADFDDYHRVLSAAHPVDKPELPAITRKAVVGTLRRPIPEFGPVRHWFARVAARSSASRSRPCRRTTTPTSCSPT
ncbi:hypothetical protein B0I31_105502 [Saccharothrix carnea]|uniref:Uncharacterized protein n=1 Tax=Saccharothrix carnea TaxID=1280637 RepID=A0A2P8IAN7_SACCR|nr:hypothetical protein [Saccharothrix carnea]PSL55536.1 hypothetical protein B0I31_105502 [Saccharothrix carnea]